VYDLPELFAQIAQVADIPTPLLYFGFLTSSLTFAAGTVTLFIITPSVAPSN